MSNRRAASSVLTLLALTCAVGWAGDGRKGAPETPDPGFLEFLGSVDRLADVNPDYLSPGSTPAPKSPPKGTAPPAPPSQPPTAASGVKNND